MKIIIISKKIIKIFQKTEKKEDISNNNIIGKKAKEPEIKKSIHFVIYPGENKNTEEKTGKTKIKNYILNMKNKKK